MNNAKHVGVKRAALLMGLTGLNTLVIFLYQWWVVTRLGPGEGTDALFAGMVIPQLVLNVINGSLAFVLVPLLTTAHDDHSRSAVSTFVASLGILLGGMSLLLIGLAPLWVPLTVPGFDLAMQSQTVLLTRIQLVGVALIAIGAPLGAAYQARHRFAYPIFASLAAAVVSLAFLMAALPRWGVEAAAWGLVLRALTQTLLLAPIAIPWQAPDFRAKQFRTALTKLFPLIGGSAYFKMDQLVDRLLASLDRPGALSLLHLVQQIYGALFQVLVNAIAGPAIPALSALASGRRLDSFKTKAAQTTQSLLLVGTIIYIGVLLIGFPILSWVFEGHKFNHAEVRELWFITVAGGLFWMAGLWGQLLSTTFYAIQDTRTPTRIGAIGFTVGIPLKVAGFFWLGVPGIILGSGLYSLGNALAMHRVIGYRLRSKTIFDSVATP